MTVLGKVPKPINLPSQRYHLYPYSRHTYIHFVFFWRIVFDLLDHIWRLENHGLDPNVEIVPKWAPSILLVDFAICFLLLLLHTISLVFSSNNDVINYSSKWAIETCMSEIFLIVYTSNAIADNICWNYLFVIAIQKWLVWKWCNGVLVPVETFSADE